MFDLEMDDGVGRLILNRPEARNAIPLAQWPGLAEAAEEAVQAGARLLLVSGTEGAFCAGADLADFPALTTDEAARARFRLAMRDALHRIRMLPIPTLAIVDGPCFGAGVALAMACDLRIAGTSAVFAITPAKLGISYPQEDIERLLALVGPGQAARLLFGAASIGGEEAERIGLVEIYAGDDLTGIVDGVTLSILANSAESLAALKRGLSLAECGIAANEEQDRRFDSLFGSRAFAERLAAMRQRRGG